ncbi:MAG: clostripain-related cysteine peptidase, partial [Acidobacteriota bacterium]
CKGERRVVQDQVAYVRFPAKAWSANNKRKTFGPPSGVNSDSRHVVLGRERLTIEAKLKDSSSMLTLDESEDAFDSPTPTTTTNRSLLWLPNIQKLSQGDKPPTGNIKAEYFNSPKTADPRLMARIDFTQGHLSTTGADPVQVPFDLAPLPNPPDPQRMPIARELLLTLEIEDDQFTLQSRDFDNNDQPTQDLYFEAQGNLEIVIGNEAAADIYTSTMPILPIDVLASPCMQEFKFYYRMCEEPSDEALYPYLSSRPGSQTCCSVAAFNPRSLEATKSHDETPKPSHVGQWTLLAYLAADNNLSAIAEGDVDKLEKPFNHEVGVVVQLDRLNRPTERLVLQEEGFVSTNEKLGNLNSGKPEVLTEFLLKGKGLKKAKHYAVFLLSHGAGLFDFTFPGKPPKKGCALLQRILRALGWIWSSIVLASRYVRRDRHLPPLVRLIPDAINPDQSAGDALDNQELAKGLLDALDQGEQFPIIGFDACVMALVEMAYELRKTGKYLIASQDDVRIGSCPYDVILRTMATCNPEKAARSIVHEFAKATCKDKFATLSAIRLCEMERLKDALNKLGGLLAPCVSLHMCELTAARNGARAFSNFHYIDLRGFVTGIRNGFKCDQAIVAAAGEVLAAIKCAVLCTNDVRVTGSETPPRAHGISVYLPNSRPVTEYYKLCLTKDAPEWRAFVDAYACARE